MCRYLMIEAPSSANPSMNKEEAASMAADQLPCKERRDGLFLCVKDSTSPRSAGSGSAFMRVSSCRVAAHIMPHCRWRSVPQLRCLVGGHTHPAIVLGGWLTQTTKHSSGTGTRAGGQRPSLPQPRTRSRKVEKGAKALCMIPSRHRDGHTGGGSQIIGPRILAHHMAWARARRFAKRWRGTRRSRRANRAATHR
ncbi:uncharacterized protein K452DRAFT_104760 [Aplosporella prunicola CBS 121167]|uniref:Uncharacterized protein n=1 Tax=Aplosporella prunicola CBS 121167 TaxID=1176127 RepID=A0A6A6BTS6_9PEZI|nr:uncharacterized protein K452DRAFT_104760 [Aplosporella prunicola CBS 121167]KAF2146031.1 hypothetical protein K452DRAFT_104760 [Aplosporella prunicola CBS 121167]